MAFFESRIKTTDQLNNHTTELSLKDQRSQDVYFWLSNYNPGFGPMPYFSWTIPTIKSVIEYGPTFSEITFDGDPYSTLTPEQKRHFWQWIDKFVVACMKNYDEVNNL